MRNKFLATRGSSLIEQALVYPILLGIVLGAADISRIMQAYSVLDEGLRSALRCVSPANGECHLPNPVNVDARYDVYERSSTPQFRAQQFSYSGEAAWFSLPKFELTRVYATVLDSVEYPQTIYNRLYQLELYRPRGTVGYALQTQSLPQISLQNPIGLVPRMTGQPILRLSAPNVEVNRNRRSASINFTVASAALFPGGQGDLRPGEKCFQQSNFSVECNTGALFRNASTTQGINRAIDSLGWSRESLAETNQYTYLVIDIRGSVSSSGGAEGTVDLGIEQTIAGQRVSRPLGGRRISGVGASNFVPRGAPAHFYSDDYRSAYPDEIHQHQAIMVKIGAPITLTFALRPDSNDNRVLEWRAEAINIYAPQYSVRTTEALCDSLVTRGEIAVDKASACPKSLHPAGFPRVDSLIIPQMSEQVLSETLCGDVTLAERGIARANEYRLIESGNRQSCGTQMVRKACPENHGIVGIANDTCAENAGAAVCPAPAQACWRVAKRDISPQKTIRWSQKDCGQTSIGRDQLPAEVLQYPEFTTESRELIAERQPLYTAHQSPARFLTDHPQYDCPAVKLEQRVISAPYAELKPDSLFRAVSSLGAQFQDRLFAEAQRSFLESANNLHPDVYFTARETVKTVTLAAPPVDPTQPYWIEPAGENDWRILARGVRRENFPPVCSQHPDQCRTEIVEASSVISADTEYSESRAKARAFAAVDAAMPGLAHQCEASTTSCAEFAIETESDPLGKRFIARGELRVPLILAPKPLIISRAARARWERDLVDK